MRETPRAKVAFNDYLNMGPDRSLEKLAEQYQSRTGQVPTRQLSRLKRWSQQHGWQARLAAVAEQERAAIVARGIADRQNRVDDLNELREKLRRVIAERAGDPLMEGVAGGESGLLVAEPMLVKVYEAPGEDSDEMTPIKQARVVHKYALDTGLVKALLDVEKQAAIELGQWEEKSQVSGSVLIREYGVPLDEV